jgi:hypothetical protein
LLLLSSSSLLLLQCWWWLLLIITVFLVFGCLSFSVCAPELLWLNSSNSVSFSWQPCLWICTYLY